MLAMKLIGERLRIIQAQREITNLEISVHFGVSVQTVSAWRKEGIPSTEQFIKMCEFLEMTPDQFIGLKVS